MATATRSRWRRYAVREGLFALSALIFLLWHGWGVKQNFTPLFQRLAHDSTRYAPRYSDAAFSQVQKGQSKVAVRALLGAPLHVLHATSDPQEGVEQWFFSDSPTGGSHAMRVVMFSADGRVLKTYAGYDLDRKLVEAARAGF